MIITFLVRVTAGPRAYERFYSTIESAFMLAYMINNWEKTIEFKCTLDECILDTIPGSAYRPSKLVQEFDYSKEI